MRFPSVVAISLASLMVLSSPGRAADGDAAKGAQIYQRCLACHSLEHNRSGPRHCGLFGRAAASLPGFDYSKAMKGTGFVWDEATLDRFLENPLKTVPGTKMAYAGVKNGRERADLIAYLRQATHDPAKCPKESSN